MKISSTEENDTEVRKKEDLENFVRKLNISIYKKIVSDLKSKMNS